MKRTLATLLLCSTISSPAFANPLYAGIQIDDTQAGALFGYQIDKTYAVEMHYLRKESSISHAGINVDTESNGIGIVGVARFYKKLRNVLPYYLFVKTGYMHTSTTETYSIPASVTLTLPYNDKVDNDEDQIIFGGGAEYYFTSNMTGRLGLDFLGTDRTINLAVIFKF